MFKFNVTVKTKNSPPIVIEVERNSDITNIENYLTLYRYPNKYRFSKSEIEYYFVERIEYNE